MHIETISIEVSKHELRKIFIKRDELNMITATPPPAYLKFTIGIRSQAAINTLDRKKYISVKTSYDSLYNFSRSLVYG
jgi:hypothetical protein